MFRLLFLLGTGIFLTLLIGGQDFGQMRHGLIASDDVGKRPVLRAAEAPVTEPPVFAAMTEPPVTQPPVTQPVVAESVVAESVVSPAASPTPDVTLTRFVPVSAPVPAVFARPEGGDAPPSPFPVRFVTAASINVREGPSTRHPVVGRLTRAEAVTVVSDGLDGWVQVRIEGDGLEGYVAARLLSDRDPRN